MRKTIQVTIKPESSTKQFFILYLLLSLLLAMLLAGILMNRITSASAHSLVAAQGIDNSINDQLVPAVAYGEGEYLVVWEHEYSPSDHDIYLRRVAGDGTPQGVRIALATSIKNEGQPAVAYNPDGDQYLVVYEYAYSATDYDIYARFVNSDGTLWGDAFAIAARSNFERNPAVAYDIEAGRFMVVWEHREGSDEFAQYDVYSRWIGADGSISSTDYIIANGSLDESAPAIAAGGSFLVTWQAKQAGSGEYDVMGQRLSSNGSLLGNQFGISTWEHDQIKPRLAFSPDVGEWLVVWEDHHWGFGAYQDIYGQRVNVDGSLDGSHISISGGNNRINPDVTYNPENEQYLVVWEYVLSASDHDIYTRRHNSSGEPQEVETRLAGGSAYEGLPVVAAGEGWAYLVVWEDDRNSDSLGRDIYSERLYPNYFLSGGVYDGRVGDTSTPIGNVQFDLRCANNPDDVGYKIAKSNSNGSGIFLLPVYYVCEYYQIFETDLTGYSSNGATTVGGTVVSSNWIRYAGPLAGKTLTGNQFFDAGPGTPDSTPPGTWTSFSPTGWQTSQTVPVSLQVEDGQSGLDVSTAQYSYSTNGGFSWSNWQVAICSGGDGTTSPQTVSASVPFNSDGGPGGQNLVRFRINDMVRNSGTSPDYTVLIDTVSPSNPTSLFSTSHTPSTWTKISNVTAQWSGAIDDRSGLAGYSYQWSQSPTTLPDTWVDTSSVSATSYALSDANNWYFHLRAIDQAGNAASTVIHLGPFYIDTTPPSSAMTPLAPNQGWPHFSVAWSGNPGGGSPIASYTITVGDEYDGNLTLSDWLVETTLTGNSYSGQRGHTYYFHVRSRDQAGNLEGYHVVADTSTTVGKDVTVQVRDEAGTAKVGAKVYHNGDYAGLTGVGGFLTIEDAMLGDALAALYQVYERPSQKAHHNNGGNGQWAYHVYLTSVPVDDSGNTSLFEITNLTITQLLTIRKDQPLIGAHLVVSVEWDASEARLADLVQAMRHVSERLYDAGDGQYFLELVEVFDNRVYWKDADLWIRASNNHGEWANVWGIADPPGWVMKVGRHKVCGPAPNNWADDCAGQAILHEFGHYGLGLWDEYRKRDGSTWSHCVEDWESVPLDGRASIMALLESTEFCSGVDPDHAHRSQTEHDAKTGGENTWETMERRYSDSQTPARWSITTPDERGIIMGGPSNLPIPAWTTVVTNPVYSAVCPPFSVHASYSGYVLNKSPVWLMSGGTIPDLNQGATDNNGDVTILGAYSGDKVLITKLIPALSPDTIQLLIPVNCSTGEAREMEVSAQSGPAPFSLNLQLNPVDTDTVRLEVAASASLSALPQVELWQEGAVSPLTLALGYEAGPGLYTGQVDLVADLPRSGYIRVDATDDSAQSSVAFQPFELEELIASDARSLLYAPDGMFELSLPAGSLSSNAILAIQQVSAPPPAPVYLTPIGAAYQPILSNGQTELNDLAQIFMRYPPDEISSQDLDNLQIYSWDEDTSLWQPIGGSHNPDFQLVNASTNKLTVFCLMQLTGSGGNYPVYLPVLLKEG